MWANICLMYLKFYVLHVMNIHVLFCFISELREDVRKSSFIIIELYSGDLYQCDDMESHFQTIQVSFSVRPGTRHHNISRSCSKFRY